MGGNLGRRVRPAAGGGGGRAPFARTRKGYVLNAVSDVPDIRDRMYEPSLQPLPAAMPPPRALRILDQGSEGACTGFGLAAAINLLNQKRGRRVQVSPRMLYEMARRFDEWKGERYSGSSCRGAIRGWHHMGVCPDTTWPYREDDDGSALTLERARAAREITLGAYYRLRPDVTEFHAALNETGVLYASADVHDGWDDPVKGVIRYQKRASGGHAFAIVGYDERGFWVQNSWGPGWGARGLALWTYEDWLENIRDAWVVQMALPTPQIFGRAAGRPAGQGAGAGKPSVPRRAIAGHFVHLDDGRFHEQGRYWSSLADVEVTARYLAGTPKYPHLLLYAHGGLNDTDTSARRISAMRDVFKANGVYPFHFMYDTGLLEEIKDVLLGKKRESLDRAGGVLSDAADRAIEWAARRPGRALWREMKYGAGRPFDPGWAGSETLRALLPALAAARGRAARSIHLVGHSTGGVLMGFLLQALERLGGPRTVASVSLMAPACSVDFYRVHYEPYLTPVAGGLDVRRLAVYNLTDRLEQDDTVGGIYNKSLLYLVSRSFEEAPPTPLLGMQAHSRALDGAHARLAFHYSQGPGGGAGAATASTTHGGFDNDPATMNHVLRTVLGRAPARPFTAADLDY